ncbi:MAG TPA: hypothetical protein DD666_00765 [Advenella kashmirensis]|uniref:Uncharacterized protein n=1 Tax=Advenella kashmirensis TaxID=310575 RepID=A0A356LBJ2_9BURK|nr:hypothetical protein [Advenella kashmirensis]
MRKEIGTTIFVDQADKEYTVHIVEDHLSAKTLNEPWKTIPQFTSYELDDGTELDYISKEELVIRESATRLTPKRKAAK